MLLGMMVLFFCFSFFSFFLSFCVSFDFFLSSLPPLSRFPTSPISCSPLWTKDPNGASIQPDCTLRKYKSISKDDLKDYEIPTEEVEYDPICLKRKISGCPKGPRDF